MSVEIRPVRGRRELRQFIFLPERIHKNHRNWLPPIYMDEWQFFREEEVTLHREV
jgi:hypothetical protein